jgi:hypothetical protein
LTECPVGIDGGLKIQSKGSSMNWANLSAPTVEGTRITVKSLRD